MKLGFLTHLQQHIVEVLSAQEGVAVCGLHLQQHTSNRVGDTAELRGVQQMRLYAGS